MKRKSLAQFIQAKKPNTKNCIFKPSSRKRKVEKTTIEYIIDYMFEHKLALTRNKFHVYDFKSGDFILLRHFILNFLTEKNLIQTILYSQIFDLAILMKYNIQIPITQHKKSKDFFSFFC